VVDEPAVGCGCMRAPGGLEGAGRHGFVVISHLQLKDYPAGRDGGVAWCGVEWSGVI
jgi:hypothetical protein